MGQFILDLTGMVEPTPFSDGTNALISLARGNWLDAAISTVSMLPYLGDIAKIGKFPKYLKSIRKAIKIAEMDGMWRLALRKLLDPLRKLIDQLVEVFGNKLPDELWQIKDEIDRFMPSSMGGSALGGKNGPAGATFEGGLYRSVPEGRNPLEIHPVFNKEKAIHRYTGEGQGGLYLGSSQRIVNSEFTGNGASIEGLINNQYKAKIDNLLDLTNPVVRNDLGVSLDDLVRTGGSKEWRYEITNPLGRYAEDSGFNGIIAPATQADGGVNLILFSSDLVK